MDKDMALGIVTKEMALGTQNGVRSTPTVFVNGVRYEGVQSAAQLLEIINGAAHGSSVALALTPTKLIAGTAANQCVKPSSK